MAQVQVVGAATGKLDVVLQASAVGGKAAGILCLGTHYGVAPVAGIAAGALRPGDLTAVTALLGGGTTRCPFGFHHDQSFGSVGVLGVSGRVTARTHRSRRQGPVSDE